MNPILPARGPRGDGNGETAGERIREALTAARKLIRFGVPVFPARVDDEGNPDVGNDRRWARWHKYPADLDILSKYHRGDALAAVCGIAFDVIDIDPRNGGKFSFNRMSDDLGDFGPVIYGKVKTPSGGVHLYIAALGIGSHNGILPGIDLKGGYPDGTGRGFVFIPPTIRPVKGLDGYGGVISGEDAVDQVRLGTYRWSEKITPPSGDASSEEISSYFYAAIEENKSRGKKTSAGNREEPSRLRQECISAPEGAQRVAMLRYVHELERKGYAKPDILVLLRSLASEMPAYDKRRPWYPARGGNPDRELLTLFHAPGAVIPDAAPGELDGLDGPSVARVVPAGLTAFSEIDRTLTQWLWKGWLAEGDITIFDGDAGNGKSLVTLNVGGRVTTGRDMPDGSPLGGAPGPILLLAPEDTDSTTAGRLEAAEADMSMVFRPALQMKKRRGQKEAKAYSGGELISFPDSIEKVRKWVLAYGIRLVIVDPISAFLGENINSGNDASVRRALAPLSHMLGQTGASAWLIRHYNKNTDLSPAHRGGGSVAFGAVSRVQIVSGIVPMEHRDGLDDCEGEVYGLSQAKNNHLKRKINETLAYTIEDSDVVADTDGNMAPRIRWLGTTVVPVEDLAGGNSEKRRGPAPALQDELISVMSELFAQSDVWDVSDMINELRSAGLEANKNTIGKARQRMGVISRPKHRKGNRGVAGWEWALPARVRRNEDSD